MADNEVTGGIMSGASAGAIFGPIGGLVGGVAGGIMGSSARRKRRKAEALQLKRNTKQAYNISKDNYANLGKSRTNINNRFITDRAAQLSRFAASGRSMDSATQQRLLGGVTQQRDSDLESLANQEQSFKDSQGYKLVQQDYDYMSTLNRQMSDDDRGGNSYSIRTEGRSGESYFTDEQKGLLRTYEDPGYQRNKRNTEAQYFAYADSLRPSVDEYFEGRFGDESQQSAFEQNMTDRINEANRVYDEQVLEVNAQNERTSRNRGDS